MSNYRPWWLAMMAFGIVCLSDAAFFMFTGMTLFYAGPQSGHLVSRGVIGFVCIAGGVLIAAEPDSPAKRK